MAEQEIVTAPVPSLQPTASTTVSSAFQGFKAPTSNTTYTPNQFFDVVIPNYSRGVVRIVAYLLRKTLGWCDANGDPQEEQVEVTYSELERRAGVSRDMIRGALDDALKGHLIDCVSEGRPRMANDAGQSAQYQLCWSGKSYTTRLHEFTGFFEGEGNRTDIPNEFFDVVIPNEPLSVIKVVGSIIRHSIGFQAKHGRRRQQVAISYQHIENYAQFGSRSDLARALKTALEKNYIIRVEEGAFSPDAMERRPATYALRWCDYPIGQKNKPSEQSENQTIISQISAPAHRSENQTSIKTKPENETVKQQQSAASPAMLRLVAEGFDETTAEILAEDHSLEEIESQIAWLDQRGPFRSRLGMLRRAIEGRWPAPAKLRATEVPNSPGRELARHFYAAFGGNAGEPTVEPSHREVEAADAYAQRLQQVMGTRVDPAACGRELASLALSQRAPLASVSVAIRQCGDALWTRLDSQMKLEQRRAQEHARASHYAQYLPLYQKWLHDEELRLRNERSDDFRAFEAQRAKKREELVSNPTPWNKTMLTFYDDESSRTTAFREFFALPDFWQWDASFNSQSFNPRT